jgi:carboxypeptidase D
MMEVGPLRLDERGEPRTVEGGWEEYINMVYGPSR